MQKIGFIGVILVLCVMSCKNNELPPQHLTNIPVVRNTEEAAHSTQNTTNNTNTPEANTYSNTTTPATLAKPVQKMQWYIIVASYRSNERQRADKLVKGLKAEGYPAQIIDAKGRLRVSIETYTSEEKAYERRAEFLKIPGFEGTWILKMPVRTE